MNPRSSREFSDDGRVRPFYEPGPKVSAIDTIVLFLTSGILAPTLDWQSLYCRAATSFCTYSSVSLAAGFG